MSTGTCTVHSYNDGMSQDESGLSTGRRFNATLRPENYDGNTATASRRTRRGGNLLSRLVRRGDDQDDDDDDEEW